MRGWVRWMGGQRGGPGRRRGGFSRRSFQPTSNGGRFKRMMSAAGLRHGGEVYGPVSLLLEYTPRL